MKYIGQRDFYWGIPISLIVGGLLSSVQSGNWFIGWAGFSFLLLLSILILVMSTRWAGGGRMLTWMVALAFVLRFTGGIATYFLLPVLGYDDIDDQSGFVYTDARRRDEQAWTLAESDRPILDAFNEKFAYDQYGGLLAFSALIYRYFSPDAHRALLLVLLSGLMGALGVPFLWKAVNLLWGEKGANASGWVFALFPESLLLGGSAMREPYLLVCSTFTFWGFVSWHERQEKRSLIWVAFGVLGMLLVSPAIALVTLVILAGWLYFIRERSCISWWMVAVAVLVFIAGLFILSSALDRQGNLGGGSPLAVVARFVRISMRWNAYQIEEDSGWVQKLFEDMPDWMHLPFVMIYGVLQPVLPAILVAPTTVIWKVIGILRSVGWYTLLPALILSFGVASASGQEVKRKLLLWLSLVVWGWVLFTALRAGGDQWDNPRYRTILFMWQAILAGQVWVWWHETRNPWVWRVLLMEVIFVGMFGQWYLNRYLQVGVQIAFPHMVAVILGSWIVTLAYGFWRDRVRRTRHGV